MRSPALPVRLDLMKACWILAAAVFALPTLAQNSPAPSTPITSPASIAPPLHTDGYRIVDARGHAVRLASASWYGFDQKEYVAGGLDHAPLATIVEQIRRVGLNSIRLPWANETLEHNPVIPDYAVAANPEFKGRHAMEIMDAVVDALAKARIMVILDNHMSNADWCCDETDGNGLWYNAEYPESKWLADWSAIVRRYRNQQWVVGADLRNELRSGAKWGDSDPAHDWHAAAERGAKPVLDANPHLLIMVESPAYSTDFRRIAADPPKLPIAHRLVYSPHAYNNSYGVHNERFATHAGFLLQNKPAVPVWIGEFGTCQTLDRGHNSDWFRTFAQILQSNSDLSWSYWPLNGAQSSGRSRKYDSLESYGLLTTDYKAVAAPKVIDLLQTVGATPRE